MVLIHLTLIAAEWIIPASVKQGHVLRIQSASAEEGPVEAVFLKKAVPLYPSEDGKRSGLVPIPVLQSPGPATLTIRRPSGDILVTRRVMVEDARFREQNIQTTKTMRTLKTSEEEIRRMNEFRASTGDRKLWSEPLSRPTPECINSPFGVKRFWDGKFSGNFHAGIDLRSPQDRRVIAAADGVVKVSRMFPRQGGTVGIDHGQGLQTTYIHLSRTVAREGRTVKRGAIIGYVGSTGFSTGPHLHFSVHVHGSPVNPVEWLKEERSCPGR
jgi:murein DD-endopeptidase MepM/ murein hydrolase activator NlpD